MFVDYYELLQISPNADLETVHRVYRLNAQRFHPDNLETGNAAKFRLISDAYQVLSDPERRASYDREHRRTRRPEAVGVAEPPVEPPPSAPPLMDEMQRREEILRLLYQRRFAHPDQPSLGLRDLENLLGTPKNALEFSLWYLKECGYLVRTDSARHTITIKGVQFAEALKSGTAKWVEGV
ncbi:MAG TPA: DnaJ domain-containing protein [Bryobacteraceae bacterium]|nr:DnaJ domain-containing protein [Bryobacteraceae bacterium]